MYTVTLRKEERTRSYAVPDLVHEACRFDCSVHIKTDQGDFNAKSIMGMMSLDPREGCWRIVTDGKDETQAAEALAAFLSVIEAE